MKVFFSNIFLFFIYCISRYGQRHFGNAFSFPPFIESCVWINGTISEGFHAFFSDTNTGIVFLFRETTYCTLTQRDKSECFTGRLLLLLVL